MTSSTKLLSVKVPLPRDGRMEHAGNDNYTSPKGLLIGIHGIQTKNPFQRYSYHTLFAYDEINKAAKRHGTKERDYEGF